MRTNASTVFKIDQQILIKETFSRIIPRIWLLCFDATKMLYQQRGVPLEVITLGNRTVPGLEINIHRTHLEVIYNQDAYQVDWDIDKQTGQPKDFLVSSNWNSNLFVFPLVMESIIDHSIKMSQQVQIG